MDGKEKFVDVLKRKEGEVLAMNKKLTAAKEKVDKLRDDLYAAKDEHIELLESMLKTLNDFHMVRSQYYEAVIENHKTESKT